MTRYTDIDKLIAEYDRVHVGPAGGARKLMIEAPIADVVEVVRCKDCKYHRDLDGGVKCERMDGLLMTLPNDFCSYGQKKGGE